MVRVPLVGLPGDPQVELFGGAGLTRGLFDNFQEGLDFVVDVLY